MPLSRRIVVPAGLTADLVGCPRELPPSARAPDAERARFVGLRPSSYPCHAHHPTSRAGRSATPHPPAPTTYPPPHPPRGVGSTGQGSSTRTHQAMPCPRPTTHAPRLAAPTSYPTAHQHAHTAPPQGEAEAQQPNAATATSTARGSGRRYSHATPSASYADTRAAPTQITIHEVDSTSWPSSSTPTIPNTVAACATPATHAKPDVTNGTPDQAAKHQPPKPPGPGA